MSPAEESVGSQQNPYAVGQATERPQSSGLLQVATTITIGIFTGLLATGIGFAVSWIAVGIILKVAAPQVDFMNSLTAAFVVPSVCAVLFGITTGLRVGWKLNAVMGRVQKVRQKRADLAASAGQLTQQLKVARLQETTGDAERE